MTNHKFDREPPLTGMRFFFFWCLTSLLACSGTSGGSVTTSSSNAAPAADLTGRWIGQATALGQTVSVTADLAQSGSAIEGTMRSPGGCIGGGKVSGSVNGDEATATVTAGDVVATLSLTVSSDDQLDGTFDLPPSGVCPQQSGSISLVRK